MAGKNIFEQYTAPEKQFLTKRFNDNNIVIIVINGINFKSLTKNLNNIFDTKFHQVMEDTTQLLQNRVRAHFAICHSDKIILFLKKYTENSELFYNGYIQKMISAIGSIVTGYFIQSYDLHFKKLPDTMPSFVVNGFEFAKQQTAVGYLFFKLHQNFNNSIIQLVKNQLPAVQTQNMSISQMKDLIAGQQYQNLLKNAEYYHGSLFKRTHTWHVDNETQKRVRKNEIQKIPSDDLNHLKSHKHVLLFENITI